MEVFRICKEKYSQNLIASGVANRWNKKGEYVIYTSSSRSLATLELVVHRNSIMPNSPYKILNIDLSNLEKDDFINYSPKNLPQNWQSIDGINELQEIGSAWYNDKKSIVLKVPSVIIPKEYNFVINMSHPKSKQILIKEKEDFFWDSRLLH